MLNNKLNFDYNYFDYEHYKGASSSKIPSGKVKLKLTYTSNGYNKGGTAEMSVNGQPAGTVKMDKSSFALSG